MALAGFDITENPTFDLRGLGTSTTYTPSGSSWDCSIGGLPFLLATSAQHPYQRSTSDWRRVSSNMSGDYGDWSLDTGYWTRAQTGFHYGAGQAFAEALESNPNVSRFRFATGGSIDPWTSGRVTCNTGVTSVTTTSTANPLCLGTSVGVLYANGTSLYLYSGGVLNTITTGGGTISSLTTDGTNWYAGTSTGVYKGPLGNTSTAGTQIVVSTGTSVVRWVKSRLMIAVANSIYDYSLFTGTALPTTFATGLLFAHPNTLWSWTDIAEGPNAIYFAGSAGSTSAIYRTTVTVSGAIVSLQAPSVVAELPRAESVYNLYTYLGTYMAVGTSSGLRIATMNNNGDLTLSPLQFTVSGGVTDCVGTSRYLYVTGGSATPVGDGTTGPGLYRLDLGQPTENGFFAWSPDTSFTSAASSTRCVTVGPTGLIFATLTNSSTGLVFLDPSANLPSGWLQLSRIRMATAENKVFRDITLRGYTPTGTKIEAYVSTTGLGNPSTWTLVGTLGSGGDGTMSLEAAASGPQEGVFVAFKLIPSGTTSPQLYSYRMRSVPAPKRTRMIQAPLLCFDFEKDRNGVQVGSTGGSWTRLAALEALEEAGNVVYWQDFTSGESRQVSVEKVSMFRTAPPTRGLRGDTSGGIVMLELRVL